MCVLYTGYVYVGAEVLVFSRYLNLNFSELMINVYLVSFTVCN